MCACVRVCVEVCVLLCALWMYGQTPDETDLYPPHACIHQGASASLCPADSNGLQLADRLRTASIGPDQRFLTPIRTMPQFGPLGQEHSERHTQ